MADNIVRRKTLILKTSDSDGKFTYESGKNNVYINSAILGSPDDGDDGEITVSSINGYYVIYFASETGSKIKTRPNDSSEYTTYEYIPIDSQGTDLYKKKEYKRLDMMIDDDTSYSILRVNPKLTGNVKVVVDSESNMYLDTFKVSLGLSQNKYRHIPINPSEYYGRTLMSKMRSIPTDDFYKIEDTCYDLFATANDFNDQYYDKYNYGVRTNTDKMYSENYSLLAPLCIRKVLPDFFLIFKINDYESLFNNNIEITDRTGFINFDKCDLVKSFDFREGTNLGTYIRNILNNNKNFVGDVYTCSDYDHFNIFNGISVERGVVSNIYEETSQERSINNQVSMNDWYTLGFQRNHIVSKDIINFEFMFDDTNERLFSLPTYFGLYVRLNGEDETFTCIDINSGKAIFDSSIHGLDFDPSLYPTIIYGLSTDKEFKRLKKNISKSEEAKSHKLEAYKSIVTVDTYDISSYNNKLWVYASNKLNDVLDPGEHYRILDMTNNTIYEVIASNFFDNDELSDISYTQSDINGKSFQIVRISILSTEYRSNIDENDKPEIIKKQLNLITKAFNKISNNIRAYNDGKSSFSLLYKKNSTGSQTVMFEKISSICGFNKKNDDIIKNTDPDNEYIDKSSYIFGCDSIEKMIIDPNSDSFDNTSIKAYYPIGFESLGTRVAYCANFMDIIYHENGETMVLINDDMQKSISPYKTVLYTTKFNENKIYRKNIKINYISIEGDSIVTKDTDPMYSIVGFGYKESYIIKFEINPLIKANGKLQFYQNFPMNSGVCSIFPLKDYYFDVLDQSSVFFVKNENNESEIIRIDGNKSEYSVLDKNVYNISIIKSENSEEFISDYCDKFRSYNIDSSGFGHMTLDSENDLGLFLSNMQKNGHNKFDISLISPYCCKWRILGTDMTGNRMRVMYNLTNPERESYSYDSSTWVDGYIKFDGNILPSSEFKTSPYINVSVYKNVHVEKKMKQYIHSVGYFFGAATPPKIYWYPGGFTEFDRKLLNKSSYIRLSVSTSRIIDGKTIDYNDIYISLYSDSNDPYLTNDTSSYWLSFDNNDHIGYLSYHLDNDNDSSIFTKYISDLYDEEETGSFNKYIYRGNGSIDDILYRDENNINKFSKIYKYGDNSIEFVSCGVKVRIKSTDKSMINLSRYVGYSVILVAMSGNNANQTGTYELFIDETKEQAALFVYNGIYSENNRINYVKNDPGIYRVKHSSKIADAKYENNEVIINDDGFIFDCSTRLGGSDIFIISKPTDDGVVESIENKQIILTGSISTIEDNHIKISSPMCAIKGNISSVNSQDQIKSLLNTNNNVDAYIITSEVTEIPTHSLTLSNLKDLTSSYAISIKTENETKKYSDISSILSISIVDPFEVKRENSNYELITKGYVHPSYAVPVMNDIFEFEYKDTNKISDKFEMSFDGCNIMISNVNKLKQTWMKKVIDIDNIMKQEDTEYHKNIITPFIRYAITEVPLDDEDYIRDVSTGSKYKEKINDSSISDFEFTVETFTPDVKTSEEHITNTYTIKDLELLVKPGTDYRQWKSKTHSIEYGTNFNDSDLNLEYNDSTKTWGGNMIIRQIGQSGSETLSSTETMKYVSRILIGTIDLSSNTSVITNLQYNDKLFGSIDSIKDSSIYNHEFYYDGTVINEITGKTMLSLRTDIDIDPGTDIKSFYFSTIKNDNPENCIKFDKNYIPNYYSENDQNGVSNLLHFTIDNVKKTSETKYKEALIQIRCDDASAHLYSTNGILESIDETSPKINYKDAKQENTSKKDDPTISIFVDQSSSVTLLRDQDPLIGYWYTNMCRLFSKYDTYISYYGAFSGFEKNNYIASRGINLKTEDQNGNITHGIDLTTWVDYEISSDENKIILNITSSIINFINSDNSSGYSDSWNKNQRYINTEDISYSSYKSKYIENTILKLIDINNNTKFILYVDKSSNNLEFKYEKPSDTSSYEEMKNLENTLVFSENRYYMNIENLEPHRYYAEMIIMF